MGKGKKKKEKQVQEHANRTDCAGKSIVEIYEVELDAIVERLMHGAAGEDDKGMASGVAYCIAVIRNPYLPNIETVREEAMERFYELNPEDEYDKA